MSVPPSITMNHVQVAEIGKNMMTLSIEISGKNLGQKTIKNNNTTGYWSWRKIHQSELCPKPGNQDNGIGTSYQSFQCGWNSKQMRNNHEIHLAKFDN